MVKSRSYRSSKMGSLGKPLCLESKEAEKAVENHLK